MVAAVMRSNVTGLAVVLVLDTHNLEATDDVANLLPYIDRLFMVARLSLSTTRTLKQSLEMLHDRKADIANFHGCLQRLCQITKQIDQS